MAGRNGRRAVEDALAAGEIARVLIALGYADDVRFCARLDSSNVVPILIDGQLGALR